MIAKKNGSGIGILSVLLVLLLAGWAVSLVVPRPTVVFSGGPRWIGEDISAGIPLLLAFAFITAFMAHRWHTRDERKLERLQDERLWDEGNHPMQPRIRWKEEQKREVADLKKQVAEHKKKAAELKKQAAELPKQQVRDEIKREEHLREERLHAKGPA